MRLTILIKGSKLSFSLLSNKKLIEGPNTSVFKCCVSLRKTETNKQYGMVSAESKKDKRTVEQVQAEIRAKKLKRLEVGYILFIKELDLLMIP